jgi:hypothetical protein
MVTERSEIRISLTLPCNLVNRPQAGETPIARRWNRAAPRGDRIGIDTHRTSERMVDGDDDKQSRKDQQA